MIRRDLPIRTTRLLPPDQIEANWTRLRGWAGRASRPDLDDESAGLAEPAPDQAVVATRVSDTRP